MFHSVAFAARLAPAIISILYLSTIPAQARAAPSTEAPDADANASGDLEGVCKHLPPTLGVSSLTPVLLAKSSLRGAIGR